MYVVFAFEPYILHECVDNANWQPVALHLSVCVSLNIIAYLRATRVYACVCVCVWAGYS